MEELGDLLRERRAARDRSAEPSAEPLLDLRVDEPVGEPLLRGEPARDRLSLLPEHAHPPADARAPSRSAAA